MITSRRTSAFALAVTLVLMALIIIVIVAYLANTRTDRSTSSIYANQLRAKMVAESGLAAATKLLKDNTRYGNYITAMPVPSPSPSPSQLYTEVYRPTDPADTTVAKANDFLQLTNAAGVILASRAAPSGTPQVDPRPTPVMIPSSGPFVTSPPGFTAADSYDFNQIVRIGTNNSARLVQPSPAPAPPAAFGQWVRVRSPAGSLIGRYAFFIEDESMKINVSSTGNNVGLAQVHARWADLPVSPAPTATPANQVQEINPSGVLPAASDRVTATKNLASQAVAAPRISSNKTLGLISGWGAPANLEDYVQMTTAWSKDDLTTARGWERMDLNGTVTSNSPASATQKIADWIKDTWTGPVPLASLLPYQALNDNRLRLQLAASIVDYIDTDHSPADFGDFSGYPVIGIEKIPYAVEIDVVYTATPQSPDVAGKANIAMKFRLNFMNIFESDLQLLDSVKTIRIKGVPIINKNGSPIFNHSTDTYELTVGGTPGFPTAIVPWGGDNIAWGVAGAKTFYSADLLNEPVNYTAGGTITSLQSGLLTVDILDASGNRLDAIKISLRDLSARWDNTTSNALTHDFLEVRNAAASMNATYSVFTEPSPGTTTSTTAYGDPRYRPTIQSARFYNLTRTDTSRFVPTTTSGDDKAEVDIRVAAFDWYDYVGDRPLAFLRDAPMQSVGELGNISLPEFPWRTVYLQYPGRPINTTDLAVGPAILDRRGSTAAAQTNAALQPQDYVLMDLFKTESAASRDGGLNINTQYNVKDATESIAQGAFTSLFAGVPAGGGVPSPTPTPNPSYLSVAGVTSISKIIANRRSAVGPLATGGPGPAGGDPPIDNNPRRPYFTIGQLATDLSWLICQSENSNSTGNLRTRSTVNYSVLRNNPFLKTEWYRNYGTDLQIEEPFRKISNAITTRGNVFRVLFVGQAVKDINANDTVDSGEIAAEYLSEAFVSRTPTFNSTTVGSSTVNQTTDSTYKVIAQRVITQ